MYRRILGLIAAIFGFTVLLPSAAFADNCRPPCANVEATVRPSSVIPGPDDAQLRGESFTNAVTVLNLTGNASQQVDLKFNFQIGSQTYTSLFVNENGLVSFGAPIATTFGAQIGTIDAVAGLGFQQVNFLSQFGVPVIAPFYADLLSNGTQSRDYLGNVVVQYGTADPYPNGGSFQANDFQNAVRITWFGLTNNGSTNNGDQVFAQLLLTGDNQGTNAFHFSYGPPNNPGQNADGSIAGFSLGADSYQFTGPYTNGIPTYFELNNGRLAGPLAAGAVPEPKTWLQLLLGFVMIGAAVKRRGFRNGNSTRLV